MITAQVEPFAVIEAAKDMLAGHWRELALNRDRVPLSPRWDVYHALEAKGELMVVTLREDNALVGYFIGIVAPGLHYSETIMLTMDIFFVHPSVRGRHGGIRLFRAVEAEAKRRGVQNMLVGSKMHRDASRLFEALRFRPIETYFSKWIGD